MQQKSFSPFIIAIVAVVLVGGGVWYYIASHSTNVVVTPSAETSSTALPSSTAIASTTPTSTATSTQAANTPDPLLSSLSEDSVTGAGRGFQYSSSINDGNNTYRVFFNVDRCVPDSATFVGPGCDTALVQIDRTTNDQTVLVPSFWQAIPSLKLTAYGQVDLLYTDGTNIYMNVYSESQNGAPVGLYAFNLQTKQVAKLAFTGSLICPAFSVDHHYVAQDTLDGSSSKAEVFSLSQNKDVFAQTFALPQTLWNGVTGTGCGPANPSWIATDTISYTVYNSLNPNPDGTFPVIKEASATFP